MKCVKLKCCPFCGAKPEVDDLGNPVEFRIDRDGDILGKIVCSECFAEIEVLAYEENDEGKPIGVEALDDEKGGWIFYSDDLKRVWDEAVAAWNRRVGEEGEP